MCHVQNTGDAIDTTQRRMQKPWWTWGAEVNCMIPSMLIARYTPIDPDSSSCLTGFFGVRFERRPLSHLTRQQIKTYGHSFPYEWKMGFNAIYNVHKLKFWHLEQNNGGEKMIRQAKAGEFTSDGVAPFTREFPFDINNAIEHQPHTAIRKRYTKVWIITHTQLSVWNL